MKRLIYMLAVGVLAEAGGVSGQQFPTEEVWRVVFDSVATCLGPVWREGDELRALVGLRDRAVIVSPNGIEWESESFGGSITAINRIDFGEDIGNEIIIGAILDTAGVIIEIGGENLVEISRYTIGYYHGHSGGDVPIYDDSSYVTIISPIISGEDNNEKRILYANLIRSAWSDGRMPRNSIDGAITQFSLASGIKEIERFEAGITTDFALVDIDSNGIEEPVLGTSQTGWIQEEIAWADFRVSAYDNELNSISSIRICDYHAPGHTWGGEFINYASQDGETSYLLSSGYRSNDDWNQWPILSEVFRLEWPITENRDTIHLDIVFRPSTILIYRENQNGRRFGLLPGISWAGDSYEGIMVVVNPDEFQLLGVMEYPLYCIDAAIVPNEGNGTELLFSLFSDRLVLSEIGSLSLSPNSPIILHPSAIILSAFPNPFNSSTTISYSLPRPGRYAIDVVDIQGRLVTQLSDGWREAGSYREVFKGNGLTSGNYFLWIENGNNKISKPITLIK